jgi:histidyl-tRNA synthetase
MHEVDVIRICDEALSQYFDVYKIRISSTEILECIFEECDIPIHERATKML